MIIKRPEVKRLIVDTDGGVDDAVALLVAERLAGPVMDVVTVGGNVSCAQAAQNAAQLVHVPVHCGIDPPGWRAEYRHGKDGLNGYWDGVSRPVSDDGLRVLQDAMTSAGTVVACLGPLTNVAAAAGRIAHVGGEIQASIIGLGGTERGPECLQDTNRRLDPDAAEAVSSLVKWVNLPEAAALTRTPLSVGSDSAYWSMLAPFATRTMNVWHWDDAFPLYDVAVICTALGTSQQASTLIHHALA